MRWTPSRNPGTRRRTAEPKDAFAGRTPAMADDPDGHAAAAEGRPFARGALFPDPFLTNHGVLMPGSSRLSNREPSPPPSFPPSSLPTAPREAR